MLNEFELAASEPPGCAAAPGRFQDAETDETDIYHVQNQTHSVALFLCNSLLEASEKTFNLWTIIIFNILIVIIIL